jgi:ribosome maturation factor RimP
MVTASRQELIELLEPAVEALGYELSDLEINLGHGNGLIRIFIDQDTGIDLEDCERVSHQVGALLDVENAIAGNYSLEVSSPGLDRKLVKPEHFDRFAGNSIKARLLKLVKGRRRIQGQLLRREGDKILVRSGGDTYSISMADIEVARLVPEL